ncbi:MAG: hypothetical protein LBK72_07960 [Bifidobacteriaceae bacterium]|jgi:hypothetical protein|nr:hypothetical protein [Bifidobacteriaceae bacterium]
MPTNLARHSITETPDISDALDAAAAIWPGEPRGRLVRRLVLAGARSVRADPEHRRHMVDRWSGFLSGAYPTGAAVSLKDEWPE